MSSNHGGTNIPDTDLGQPFCNTLSINILQTSGDDLFLHDLRASVKIYDMLSKKIILQNPIIMQLA